MTSIKINAMLALTVFLWSSAFVGIRIGLTGYSPGSLALFRFLVASVCMMLVYHRHSYQKIPLFARLQLILLGMVGISVYHIALNYGELTVSAGVASFIIGLMPVITLLISILFLKERPNLTIYVGLIISLIGLMVMVIAENTHSSITQGTLFIFIAACSGSIFAVALKSFLRLYNPVAVTSWTLWGGMFLLLIFSRSLGREILTAPIPATLAVIYMGIFPAAVAYIAWSYVLRAIPASKASISLYAIPVVSTILGYLILQEIPTFPTLIGGLVALIGALIATSRSEHTESKDKTQ